MSYLSVSTWSLHRLLGPLRWTAWDEASRSHVTNEQPQPEEFSLLELPGEAAERGYQAVEVCHFHFPSVEPAYLASLKEAFAKAGLSFDTLLLDYGDITTGDPVRLEADLALVRRWIDIAAAAGAKRIRVVAGQAPHTDEAAIRDSAARLTELAEYANGRGVRVVSENFQSLTRTGASCSKLLELTGDAIGFITDFGNFQAPTKYDEFLSILPHSVSVHAKAAYDANGLPDEAEFRRCLDTVKQTGYNGAVVLIYDGPGDMWAGLKRIRAIVNDYL
ncbi:sugar phosphate isomerase/epimerase family protein [Cohnella candidum]|uniref:Sugar phosphate isomerase/epimerase n=1 Tax=Cohnella candidum TaxID=2674991 RepID=A0A3G3K4I6_9BACL|nr:sugar phosphate isomerase/epimerase family protein [Cohnella candidum]AYQ74659.1 sugar phosphate isomerase/epimerase [Cohnella candidum]